MDTIMNTIKSFTTPAPEHPNPAETETTHPTNTEPTSHPSVAHSGDAHAPEAPTTIPGSFEHDSSTPQATPAAEYTPSAAGTAKDNEPQLPPMHTSGLSGALSTDAPKDTEPHLPPMQTSELGGALSAGHLTHLTHVDADNASTTAVQDEPDSTSPEKKGAFREEFGGAGETGLEEKLKDVGLGEKSEPTLSSTPGEAGAFNSEDTKSHDATPSTSIPQALDATGSSNLNVMGGSNLNSDSHALGEQEPAVSSLPGKVGAFDSEGTKVHESTDLAPKAFGAMGGEHLNSSDNRGPSSSSFGKQEPTLTSFPGKVGAFDSEGTKAQESTDSAPKGLGVMGGEHLNSSDNRGPTSSLGEQEPAVTSLPGKVGAFDSEGTKVHESTDSAPKTLGVMGGEHLNSSDNRGPSSTSQGEQEPTVSSVPGKVGAFDSEGTKVHESTDESPKAFGVMGGEHLNSPDNRAETAGKPLQDDRGNDILGPGPAMMELPPTEPASTADLNAASSTPRRSRSPSPASPSRDADSSNVSTTAGKSLAPPTDHEHQHEPRGPTPTGRSLTPTPGRGPEDHAGLEKKASQSSDVSEGGSPRKVKVGEKVKGLMTEMKGHVKKDPALVEEGKAIRHGEAHVGGATPTA